MSTKMYAIRNSQNTKQFWRSHGGWAEEKNASEWTGNDRHKLPLPPFGEWVEIESRIRMVKESEDA